MVAVGPEDTRHPALKEVAALLRGRRPQLALHRPGEARVGPVELGVPPFTDSELQKGVEVAAQGTPGEQIGPRGLELAGARSTEDEGKPPILDVAMALVEQRREALDLVHDNHGSGR